MAELPFREIYEVGGSLRDELLGREPKDVDFLVRGHDVEELLTLCRRYGTPRSCASPGGSSACASGRRGGRARASRSSRRGARRRSRPGEPGYTGNPHTDFRIEPDAELPVRDDLERRDFTVNAMARDVRSGEWIDPFGGRDDLAAGVLRAVHPTAFRDDPLRILRGVARCSIDGLAARRRDARAHDARQRRASPSCRPSACARSSTARSSGDGAADGAAARPRCRRARGRAARVGALHRLRPALVDTQAYTARRAHPARARRGRAATERLARPAAGGVLARRRQAATPGGPGEPRRGRRAHRPTRAAAPDLRQRHASRRSTTLVREHSYDEDREPIGAGGARLPRARGARARAATCWRCAAGIASGAASRSAAEDEARARALRGARRAGVGAARRRSPTSRCAATTCMAAGVPGGPAIGATLAAAARGRRRRPVAERARDAAAHAWRPESID